MLIVMDGNVTGEQIETVQARIGDLGLDAHVSKGRHRVVIGIVGNDGPIDPQLFQELPGVAQTIPVTTPYKQVSREWSAEDTRIQLGNGTVIGGGTICVMAGPCAVESREQLLETAERMALAGATVLRGGAFKPRTSPYAFQGLREEGLKILAEARRRFGLAIITEAIDHESLDLVEDYADIIQLGARNMQNFSLLQRAGRARKPVMLKRGLSSTIQEWLLAAEYIVSGGNRQVILCERGIRSYDDSTRNVFDISAIPLVKQLSHLPVVADPSHGTGRRSLIAATSRAAIAAGADGLLIEVHRNPDEAKCDGKQSLFPEQFEELMASVHVFARALDKQVTVLPQPIQQHIA